MDVSLKKQKEKNIIFILVVLVIISVAFSVYRIIDLITGIPNAKLVLYDGPKLIKQAEDTRISVNGNRLFVYDAPVNNTHQWVMNGNPPMDYTPMTYFDFDGQAKIKISLAGVKSLKDVKISPLEAGIKPEINGNTISFTITKPDQYVVEYNGSVKRAVTIFANPLEKYKPNLKDSNTFYVGPGVWDIGNVSLENGQTLYLAGGAVVYGTVNTADVNSAAILGRGIIDGSKWDTWTKPGNTAKVPVNIVNSQNVVADGIILMNPNAWTFNVRSSKNITVNNVKIMSARQNGDGFTIQSCNNVKIANSFVRSWDDSLVVKNYEGNSNNITFDNIKVWTDLAQSCEVGYETNKGQNPDPKISNITFSNITVLHNFHKPVLSIHNADNALISDIKFKNIVVEDAMMGQGDAGENRQLIDITIKSSNWSTTKERGNIRDVSYENIKVLGGIFPPSQISGYDDGYTVEGVTIKGLNIFGKDIKSLEDGKIFVGNFVSGVSIE